MELALLEALRQAQGEWVETAALVKKLPATPEEVARAAESLRQGGYEVDSSPSGYRLPDFKDGISAEAIRRELGTRLMGSHIIALGRTESTNDVAWREALSGAPEGAVILAEEQTAGRGRMGRKWYCPPRTGLLMSVILRPELSAQQSNLLTVMAAVAVSEAISEHLQLRASIRWPNDITIRDRKVAGILVEARSLATGAAFVLGIGINVNTTEEAFTQALLETATSLAIEASRPVHRTQVARWVLRALERWYRDVRFGEYGRIARQWRRLSSSLGERVVLLENGREYRGRVLDLSLEDGLIVRLDEGVTRIFHPATVTLRQLPETWRGLHRKA